MPPESPHPYDDNLRREIADFNARYAQPVCTPDTAPTHDGGLPDDDPDWIAWQKLYNQPVTSNQEQSK